MKWTSLVLSNPACVYSVSIIEHVVYVLARVLTLFLTVPSHATVCLLPPTAMQWGSGSQLAVPSSHLSSMHAAWWCGRSNPFLSSSHHDVHHSFALWNIPKPLAQFCPRLESSGYMQCRQKTAALAFQSPASLKKGWWRDWRAAESLGKPCNTSPETCKWEERGQGTASAVALQNQHSCLGQGSNNSHSSPLAPTVLECALCKWVLFHLEFSIYYISELLYTKK